MTEKQKRENAEAGMSPDTSSNDPRWLEWAKRLQALAQNGLAYNRDPFNVERYEAIRQIASEIMATHTDWDTTPIHDLFAGQLGHATPKVDVRGAVFRDNQLLFVRERADGKWSVPGGWADVYDTPSEATVREVYEESGYRTRPIKLVAVYDRSRHGHPPMPYHVYKLFFQLELIDPEQRAEGDGKETHEAAFFAEDALPELSLGRVTAAQIARLFAHYRDPSLLAEFD
jgi:ADP-ribose pyrophosphatase YjhB (NUDIX family)